MSDASAAPARLPPLHEHRDPQHPPGGLLKQLRRIVGRDYVLQDAERQRVFESDGLPVYRQLPMVTVLPADEAQVKAVLEVCDEHATPVVTRGAGTGLSAGALPDPAGVLLVLSRLDRIVAIDADNERAVVEPGVRNLAVSEAAAAHGLFYAPDPSSQIACSIGGNVAENAGGIHCLKYGLTTHNLLALEGFTVTGEALSLQLADNPGGFNLLSLLTGSEGMLAVVTRITLRLLPLPPAHRTLMAVFDDVRDAGQAVAAIIAAGLTPAALEMMDRLALQAAEDFAACGYPRSADAILLIDVDGDEASCHDQLSRVQEVLESCAVRRTVLARDEQERHRFWEGRKSAFPAVGRLSPDYFCMDGTIPRRAIAEVLGKIRQLSAQFSLPVANVFHAGDGNLHPLILFDANDPEQLQRAEALGAAILETCLMAGGCITGEHGVGIEKIRQMPLQFTDTELAQLHAVRTACDPHNRLNPGKLLPNLRHCQEYRSLATLWSPSPQSRLGDHAVNDTGDTEDPVLAELQENVRDAVAENRPLCIEGNQTKSFLGFPMEGEVLSCRRYSGILSYHPSELTITARAGTPLEELEAALAEHGQMLACDPPHFGDATLGGMIGAGLAGPNRPVGGNVADQILGCRLLNGRGELLRFGGQVMKNVAGFDLSRLMCGSMGCLGLLTEVTLRVRPAPEMERTFRFDISMDRIAAFVRQCRLQGFPVSASCHDGSVLHLRFSGSRTELSDIEQRLNSQFGFIGMEEEYLAEFWLDLREHRHEFFHQRGNLWRIVVPSATPELLLPGKLLTEWHGGLRWLISDASAQDVLSRAGQVRGSACLFSPENFRDTQISRFQPPSGTLVAWNHRLKQAFDPEGVFNYGRMYPEL